MSKFERLLLTLATALILLPGCSLADLFGKFKITTGNSSLIIDKNVTIDLYEENTTNSRLQTRIGAGRPVQNFDYTITYISQIKPPKVNNTALQANDILIAGNNAYIAYNTAGEVFAGAVQIIAISGKKLEIIHEIIFPDMDIMTIQLQGNNQNNIMFGGAADPDIWGFRSFIGTIDVKTPNSGDIERSITGLSSYATTGIAYHANAYYVGVGAAQGGIALLDDTLKQTSFINAPDIRDVEKYQGGVIALAGTTDSNATAGRILIIKDGAISREIPITDFGSQYAKATIEVVSNTKAMLGLSEAGFYAFDMDTNTTFFTLNNPDNETAHSTNSVSFENSLIFTANGEYGFRVLKVLDQNATGSNYAEIVGYHKLEGAAYDDQNYSVNHIEYKGGYLFTASGVGGVCVYEIK